VAGQVGGDLVLPLELVRPAESWPDEVVWSEAKRRWFRDHGIDPSDWAAVYPVFVRSGTVHGCPLSLERARLNAAAKERRRRPRNP